VASLEEPEIKGWERAKITLLRILNLTVQLKKSKSTEIITNYVSKFRIIEDFIAKSSCSIKHSVIVSEFHDFLKTAPTSDLNCREQIAANKPQKCRPKKTLQAAFHLRLK
jgi:hypothetical protein